MSQTIEIPQPIMSDQSSDMDGGTKVEVYDRYDMECTLRQLLEANYGISHSNSAKNPENEGLLGYRNSGVWYKSRGKHGELEITASVGCSCSHDCCGHLCGLSYTIQQTESHFIVVTSMRYNY